MRRFAVVLLMALVAGCSTAEAEPSTTTAMTPAPTTTTTQAPAEPAAASCPSITNDLDRLALAVGLSDLAGAFDEGPGPMEARLLDPEVLADEMGLSCSGSFVAASDLGEVIHVHAAWDAQVFWAMGGGFTMTIPSIPSSSPLRDLAGLDLMRFNRVSDSTKVATPHGWWLTQTLEGFVLFDGEPAEAVMGAWSRVQRAGLPAPVLSFTNANGDGSGVVPDYTLYADGMLITPGSAARYLATFKPGIRISQLSQEQVNSIREAALATGVTDGASFAIDDSGSQNPIFGTQPLLVVTYWHEDVGYSGWGPQLQEDEITEPRRQAQHLEELLHEAARSTERTNWMDGDVVVRVERHGLYDDANAMDWPGEFNLAEVSGEGCIVLAGDEAAAYRADVALVGDEYQHVLKTFFDYDGILYSVYAMPLLPGDPMEQFEDLSWCNDSVLRVTDPVANAWLWGQRGIADYEMTLRLDCASCADESIKLDGATSVAVPGWFEVSTVDDLFDAAASDRFDLTEFTADGIVGLPLIVGISDCDSGETLRLLTTWFTSEMGTLDVDHDEFGEIWISPRGFDDWMPQRS
jgi:hypothetical protein